MATKQKHSKLFYIFIFTISFVIGFVLIVGTMYVFTLPSSYEIPGKIQTNVASANVGELDVEVIKNNDLSIHFMELGNKYTGDSTYIKCGDVDILIDAGSRTSSVSTISNYINNYCTDGVLEYVIVTHAHQDHYAGFATTEKVSSIFDLYVCENIIDFARTNQKETAKVYGNYLQYGLLPQCIILYQYHIRKYLKFCSHHIEVRCTHRNCLHLKNHPEC